MRHGVHIGKQISDLETALENSEYNSAQVFLTGPKSWKDVKVDSVRMKQICKKMDIYVHATYMSVLHNPGHVLHQYHLASRFGARGLVFHIERKTTSDFVAGLQPIASGIRRNGPKLLLEMPSYKVDPMVTYTEPARINQLVAAIDSRFPGLNYGICIDTAHLHGSGVSVVSRAEMDTWLAPLNPRKIGLIHLNGAITPFGCGYDQHAPACGPTDLIWGRTPYSKSGCAAIVEYACRHQIPVIQEINDSPTPPVLRALNSC